MNDIIEQMLQNYSVSSVDEEINALKEIMQEIILSGLARTDFFDNAAFYGGTALRIFYNLDRFSENLDFSLIEPNEKFDLSIYFDDIKNELLSYGINLEINTKKKSIDSNITSAFLKGNTIEHILKFFPNTKNQTYNQILKDIKIKFEIDINPPSGASYEFKTKLLPSPHKVKLYDKESLFAGKIHAILCRDWKSRTKGRDLYDYLFFISNNTKINMNLLKNKLIESNFLNKDDSFNINILKEMLINKFNDINYEEAKTDVDPFLKNKERLNNWNKDLFISVTNDLIES